MSHVRWQRLSCYLSIKNIQYVTIFQLWYFVKNLCLFDLRFGHFGCLVCLLTMTLVLFVVCLFVQGLDRSIASWMESVLAEFPLGTNETQVNWMVWADFLWTIADLLTSSHPQMSASHLLGLPQLTFKHVIYNFDCKLKTGASNFFSSQCCNNFDLLLIFQPMATQLCSWIADTMFLGGKHEQKNCQSF